MFTATLAITIAIRIHCHRRCRSRLHLRRRCGDPCRDVHRHPRHHHRHPHHCRYQNRFCQSLLNHHHHRRHRLLGASLPLLVLCLPDFFLLSLPTPRRCRTCSWLRLRRGRPSPLGSSHSHLQERTSC